MSGCCQESQQKVLHEEEEHRLAYVGMTRARKLLYLTCLRRQWTHETKSFMDVEPAAFLTRLYDSHLCSSTGSCLCCWLAWMLFSAASPACADGCVRLGCRRLVGALLVVSC